MHPKTITNTPASVNLSPANSISEGMLSSSIINHSLPSFTQGKALPHKRQQIIAHTQTIQGLLKNFSLSLINIILYYRFLLHYFHFGQTNHGCHFAEPKAYPYQSGEIIRKTQAKLCFGESQKLTFITIILRQLFLSKQKPLFKSG